MRFKLDESDTLVADEHGDLTYHEAVSIAVDDAVAMIEEALWNLVDDVQYLAEEESSDPGDE